MPALLRLPCRPVSEEKADTALRMARIKLVMQDARGERLLSKEDNGVLTQTLVCSLLGCSALAG